MAVISIIQRHFYALLAGVAICPGIGWRFGSEQGGDFNRNRVAICSGIRISRAYCQARCYMALIQSLGLALTLH
jgi:hypothetical protein